MDENENSSSCSGGGGADGSTVDGDGLATVTTGDIVTDGSIAIVGIGGDANNVDGAAVDDGIMVPMLADDADGASVGCRISFDGTKGVPVDDGSIGAADGATVDDETLVPLLVNGADDALVDEESVDAADGATVDAEISVGGSCWCSCPSVEE